MNADNLLKKPKNILVVDQDKDFCRNVRLYLEQDYKIITRQRLKYVDYTIILNNIDLFIIDADFNRDNLLKFIQDLKRSHLNIKIIVMYTYFMFDKETEKKLYRFSDDMIAKPFDVSLLKNKVDKLFNTAPIKKLDH
jgi:DNA-binding NtrC family response regulator